MTADATSVTPASGTDAVEMVENQERVTVSSDTVSEARELAERIHRSADILLDRLLSHLSQLPEATSENSDQDNAEGESEEEKLPSSIGKIQDDDGDGDESSSLMLKRGLTVPVSAVAWLSDQLGALATLQKQHDPGSTPIAGPEDDREGNIGRNCFQYDMEPWLGTEAASSLRYRLSLLRFLLPRAELIRLTRQRWPQKLPQNNGTSLMCSSTSSRQRLKRWWRKRRSSSSHDDDITEASMETRASEFLRYASRFQHGASKCVNLSRVFPNATVLILVSVPPSWIDTKGRGASRRKQKGKSLRLISVTNAAIYDLEEFLPPLSVLSSDNIPSLPSPIQLSHSLTHLKLDNCSLGELTSGFASSLQELVHLEYLSLRQNQFRSAKTILRGLRPLIRLRYLDVSANRLMGCFGPYANLCLGGQVRTLKLSENFLETCRNSGLEKCYALRELWLDSNRIEDVLEVSGLAQLPELQCLALQRNPFSTKTPETTHAKDSSSLPPAPRREISETTNLDISIHDNPLYDPKWKIRLWTWFQHERRAKTPLELPLLNKKTRNLGFNRNGCNTSLIGRMSREEWNKIQEESYLIAAPAITIINDASLSFERQNTLTSEDASARIEALHGTETNSIVARVTDAGSQKASKSTSILDHLALQRPLLAPVRNRRVIKKSKTRLAKIHIDGLNIATASIDTISCNMIKNKSRGKPKKMQKSTRLLPKRQNNNVSHIDAGNDNIKSSLRESQDYFASLIGGDENISRSDENSDQFRSSSDGKTSIGNLGNKTQHLSFSLQDVLASLQNEHLHRNEVETIENKTFPVSVDEHGGETQKEKLNTESSSKERVVLIGDGLKHVVAETKSVLDSSVVDGDAQNKPSYEDEHSPHEISKQIDTTEEENRVSNIEENDDITKALITTSQDDGKESKDPEGSSTLQTELDPCGNNGTRKERGRKKKKKKTKQKPKKEKKGGSTESKIPDATSKGQSALSSSPNRVSRSSPRRIATIDEDRIFVKPKVASIKLHRMGKPFDALCSDWDDLVKKASEGRIPDGLIKSPVDQPSNDFAANIDIFSDEAANLLGNTTKEPNRPFIENAADQASASRSTIDPTIDPSNNQLSNALPQHIWQDDNSVLSSLGASRDEISPKRVNKFQLAEENCSYDGPESSRGMKVVENLQLYFETFVFQTSMPDIPVDVLAEMEENQDDWQLITMYYPRIQLWPEDRRILERISISSSMNNVELTANRERFLRVWEEDLVPCGKPALRRLPPNRRNRLGFHGDKLFQNAEVDAYAECRKVLLCLSSKAFYVIPETDDVTASHQQQAKKRRFPLPLDRAHRFRDAPWPHAVARHCLGDLEAICIGFEFQRLTLRFRNQSFPKRDPFVYVLLTGNKQTSVRIYTEIQKLIKDLPENNAISVNDKNSSSIATENDSQIVLDSLNNLIDSSGSSSDQEHTIGTITHFQIVQQQWKHGDRGTVRRVFVVTDTKILLLDEDYAADGHDLSSVTVTGKNMADARYRLVDQASLSLVSQVQAAGTDPRAITIIINPSTLSRTRRWRLICRDREGAENLVENARRALETR